MWCGFLKGTGRLILFLTFLQGCSEEEKLADTGNDCAAIEEICDGLDNNCDGIIPANEVDADGDGYMACEECADGVATINPDAEELCDGFDNNCDDIIDDQGTWYEDSDADGFGNPDKTTRDICDNAPQGYVANADDCDDTIGTMPGNDKDCDGTLTADDCNDNNPNSNIRAEDADCDGVLTANDCDDNDTSLRAIQNDADCDGAKKAKDCNDNDPNLWARADDPQCDGAVNLGNGVKFDYVIIDGGVSPVGCEKDSYNCTYGEYPRHDVMITRTMHMMKAEVTQKLYKSLIGTNPSSFPECGDNCPVDSVSWNKAIAFANTLSEMAGLDKCYLGPNWPDGLNCNGWRLPTEGEWEYAARASENTNYAGSNSIGQVAWFEDNSLNMPNPVCQKDENANHLCDMSGNLFEWVWDKYSADYYRTGDIVDPLGPNIGSDRTRKGGSWRNNYHNVRIETRNHGAPSTSYDFLGFRLVRSTTTVISSAGFTGDCTAIDDADCDGYMTPIDCDDNDSNVFPGNAESCDGKDNNCDGIIPALETDNDGDGFVACNDCDDTDPSLNPDAIEKCDGIDNNCDGFTDDQGAWFYDDDGDGYGDPLNTVVNNCNSAPVGYVANNDDCDDTTQDTLNDNDCDGVLTADDCDDWDSNSTVVATDADCDGILTADDCDDTDSLYGAISLDPDCDGFLGADDCDENDALATNIFIDADCDSILSINDCDDNDPAVGSASLDADCDGTATADDCDDNDVDSTTIFTDADCDGTLTADDCDDNDPNSTIVSTDADCDTFLNQDDCNDFNALVPAQDADCDGTFVSDDCDDNDPNSNTLFTDADCDGTLTADDCDDNDASSNTLFTDADCDGALTADDCDDNDISVGNISLDADCDGALTADDCDDNDSTIMAIANDLDCDGAVTAMDCDDNDASMPSTIFDSECDGSSIINGIRFDYILLNGGSYEMGCTADQGTNCPGDELPTRIVEVTLNLAVMKSEVTQELYETVMGVNPSHYTSCGSDCPVESVSWLDAVSFANALSSLEGLEECYTGDVLSKGLTCTGWRLPTEGEWEYLARGGESHRYSGANYPGSVAWYENNCGASTQPVCTRAVNGFGICDMSGNVFEWVGDWFDQDHYDVGNEVDPTGPTTGSERVRRGGAYLNIPDNVRVGNRNWGAPTTSYDFLGIRLIRAY